MKMPSRPTPAFALAALVAVVPLAGACGSDPVRKQPAASEPDGGVEPSDSLTVEVSATRKTFVDLSGPSVIEVDDAASSQNWDLAFIGYDVLTNGGLSGPGAGAAFGPLPISFFAFPDEPVDAPFLIEDRAGGAFLGWYAYDGTTHTIYSRYHVYGFRSGDRLYKLQVLGYYGDVQGAPVSALYQLRYAEVTPDGSGETREVADVDGTLDGAEPSPDVPNTCLVLATGDTVSLSPNEAAGSVDWDICFRREAISVNGEIGGPGSTSGVDLQALETADEALADVKTLTAKSELARFDAIDYETLTDPALEYRGDFVTSAFTGKWVDLTANPPAPRPSVAFLVREADGKSYDLLAFNAFDGATPEAPGSVHIGIQKAVGP